LEKLYWINMDFIITKATEKDIPYLSNLIQIRWDYSKEDADKEIENFIPTKTSERIFCLRTETEKDPIGTGMFSLTWNKVPNYSPWFFLLWVEPKYRGNKLGEKLTKVRLDYVKSLGFEKVYLDTTDAFSYHKKHGWNQIDVAKYNGENNIIMEYDLNKN